MRRACIEVVLSLAFALGLLAAPALGADAYEPNDTSDQATGPLIAGQTYAGDIDHILNSEPGDPGRQDEDWYRFSVAAPAQISIEFNNDLATNSCFGPEAQLIDPAGTVVGTAQPPRGRTDAITYDVPAAGDYLLRLHPYTIEPCPPPDEQYHFRIMPSDAIVAPPGQTGLQPKPAPRKIAPRRSAGLRLTSATLKKKTHRLRVVGKLGRGASLAKVRVAVMPVGGRVAWLTLRVHRVSGGRWVASAKLSGRLRKLVRLGLRASYLGDVKFAAKRLPVRIVRAR